MAALGTYSYIISGISYIIHIFELHGKQYYSLSGIQMEPGNNVYTLVSLC